MWYLDSIRDEIYFSLLTIEKNIYYSKQRRRIRSIHIYVFYMSVKTVKSIVSSEFHYFPPFNE